MKLLNEKKLVFALQAYPEAEDDVIGLYSQANLLEDMIAQRNVAAWNAEAARVINRIYGDSLQGRLLAVAKQAIGVISRLQRETGFKIINRYLAEDEEKLELLQELCDLFNDADSLSEAIG